MAVGRASHSPGGGAVGVLNLDNEPPAAAIAEILQNPNIKSAQIVKLPPAGDLPTWLQ
jgi:D-3-phosphoglycerate dehydrogenase